MTRFQTFALVVLIGLTAAATAAKPANEVMFAPTNLKSGISLSLSGTNWAVEQACHDELIAEQIIYLRAGVEISLAHNERNVLTSAPRGTSRVLGVNGPDGEPNSGDEGTIHYKIDRDMQAHPYISDNIPEWAPVYVEPVRFDQLTYDGTRPVLGAVGDNGEPWGGAPGSTTKRFAYGQRDEAGNEWHTLTYWDDDLAVCKAMKIGGRTAASDGHCVFVCVNPVTPVIQVVATDGGQFYTTPIKTYHVPKTWTQTTYLTKGVAIRFAAVGHSEPIFYRIDDDHFRRYDGELLLAEDLFMPKTDDEPSILEVRYGEDGPLLRRAFVFEPEYPAAGERHGFCLWADEAERKRAIERVHNVEPFATSYRTFRGDWYQGAGYAPGPTRGGWRSGASQASGALSNALVANFEGPAAATAEATRCKQRLLYSARLQPIGFELNVQSVTPAKDFINELGQTTQQYADLGVAYDLLIACFRKSNHPDGITPIEEIIIRDNLAKIAKSILQFRGNYRATSGGGNTHWGHGFELALGTIALAMPTYKSPYYGVSGGDRTTVNDLADDNGKYWNPFPDQPVTWYAAATDPMIDTPGHPNVIRPMRAEFLLTDDGYWTGPNDLQGDGSRYVKGPRGNKLVGVHHGGLANAENRVENNEMGGYESPFVTRAHVLDLMRRLAGDDKRAACVTNYINRRLVGGVVRLGWDKGSQVYVPRPPAAGCLAAFNRHYPSSSQPAAKALVTTYLEQLKTYYAGGDLDPAVRKWLDQARKGLYNAYILALCEDPAALPDPPEQANRPPILKTLFKYVVTPGTAVVKDIIVTDLEGDELTLTVAGLPAGAAFDAAARQITWTPAEADLGVHIVTVTVEDGQASVTRPFPILVKAELGVGPVPPAPAAATAELGEDGRSVKVNWTPPTGDVTPAAYVVYRDGALWAATDGATTHFVDAERVVPTSHTRYHVATYSTIGAESAARAAMPNPIVIDR